MKNISSKLKSLQSSSGQFEWKRNCCLCAQFINVDERHPVRSLFREVQTLEIKDSLLTACMKRDDKWSMEVRSRLQMCSDLVAAGAVYHKACVMLSYKVEQSLSNRTAHRRA